MSRIKRVLSLSSVLALSVYVWGCDSGKNGGAGDNILSFEDLPETGEEDRAASQGKADEAQAEMERVRATSGVRMFIFAVLLWTVSPPSNSKMKG